ncbi:efflux RND transporter permease subunit [Caecibacteroides pullorum]|uniref:Efflux RND transporter permease subunit n=1 Tax=Caecibacteroides pullorum TaxID=2725562 RepID=A0AA40ZTT7_9BACT|nr:efflux RND transporter permease subunit [Caecibacteroides pullorum]MBM6857906.1 efflux RND transporter permease subunit [Caecibacteroides pullorum]MBV8058952.1 efflux RND transporter permease subunit [Caecibacteroides pullorum]
MKTLAKFFLKNCALSWLLLALILLGGVVAYVGMGKLEDAPFTIKQAVVTTTYPGASPLEVQQQVTDVLEEAIQSLGELYYLKTENRAGLSKITVYVKKEIRADAMQQLWDKLRRKVSDAQGKLPAGASTSVVNDDFGDVLGVFYGLSSAVHTYRELEEQAERLKNELLAVPDVARVELYGVQNRTIEVEADPSLLAASGLTMADIAAAFDRQNRIVDAGAVETAHNRLRIDAAGSFTTPEELENLTVTSRDGSYFRLGELAAVSESYVRPARSRMEMDGLPTIGIAISTVADGNVVDMAERVAARLSQLEQTMPEGYRLRTVYDQGHESSVTNDGFVLNLIISVVTVIAVLLFFIGMKNGILIGSGLVFSIFGTLIYMYGTGIALQRMSLAAIIIAMGMLVDNAIVVYDATLVNMQRGMRKRTAILAAVGTTAMPLLGATLIAVLTFLPVYLSPHITGELLSSLFIVIAVSLLLSWVLAVSQNVFFVQEFVRRPRPDELKGELFQGRMYDRFRRALRWTIRRRWFVLASMVVLLAASALGFRCIPQQFMPLLDKQYFSVDVWLPEGTRVEETSRQAEALAEKLMQHEGVRHVSTFVGQTPPRYYLANAAYGPQSNYAQCLVEAVSPSVARSMQVGLQEELSQTFSDALIRVNRFELNSIPQALIEARFCGDDPRVLDSLTSMAIDIMRRNPKVMNARNEWGNKAMLVRAAYDPVKAGRLNLGKADLMTAVKSTNDGTPVGIYRDGDKQVPVLLRTVGGGQLSQAALEDLPVWNGRNSVPLAQVTDSIGIGWEWPLVKTYNRRLSMAAQCDVQPGHTMKEVHSEIRDEIERIGLPAGYSFFWDSQYKDQKEAMEALIKYFPLAIVFLVLILVALFGNFRQPSIIFLILPLSVIGVVVGMLVTGFQFGFFCIAGWLGLLGMIIKNVIVLLDEVNIQRRAGVAPGEAIVEATVSRTRPVLMAAITTIFGSIPLLFDVVFGGMAATIVFGLSFATLLTLFVTPALYAVFYPEAAKRA